MRSVIVPMTSPIDPLTLPAIVWIDIPEEQLEAIASLVTQYKGSLQNADELVHEYRFPTAVLGLQFMWEAEAIVDTVSLYYPYEVVEEHHG